MSPQLMDIALHISHRTRDLSVICSRLGLTPAIMWTAGDERQTPKGTRIGGRGTGSYCSIPFGRDKREPLAKRIRTVLRRLKPHRRALRTLSATGGPISLFVGWFCDEHAGDTLEFQLLRVAADLRIAIDLNIYVPDSSKTRFRKR
ncbi:DUF4279 domain-containing protein [Bradyrhizobium sp. CCGUVB23]|uniref:DUF4279 domain-containing protein n=1 Tax=Bradyrhizobium sp. CCGUVB23 TaxID=2949630 RepID=UPI003531B64D